MNSLNEMSENETNSGHSCSVSKAHGATKSEKQKNAKKTNNSHSSKSDLAQNNRAKKASLFRAEAVEAQNNRLDGGILISHSLTHRNFALFYALVCILIISFLCFGTYTRKITVVGFLEPEKGLSRVYPSNGGRISNLFVNEGDKVMKGDALAYVIIDSVSDNGQYAYERIAYEIKQSIQTLHTQREKAIEDYVLEKQRLSIEIESYAELHNSLRQQKAQIVSKNELILEKLKSIKKLQEKGSISLHDYNNEKMSALDSAISIDTISASISEAKHKYLESKLNLKKLPFGHTINLGEINQKISDLQRQLADAKLRHAYTIVAPVDGYVSALTYRNGDTLSTNYPLLSIMPEWTKMQAKIYLPSSTISFIHEGQDINIQYQALPVQRFGTYPGKVVHISSTPVNPDDFKGTPLKFDQPMYVVTAEVYDQNIELEDSTFPIVAGMAVSISLLAEKQSIIEWLLDPFWDIKGRFQ